MRSVKFQDLGLMDYKEAWSYQEKLFHATIDLKMVARKSGIDAADTTNHLLFCEHPHVFTMGKSGKAEHLLANPSMLKELSATYYKINRGGDITYHGPGQLIGYPIFDLDHFFSDIHKYLRYLEEAVIMTLAEYQIESGRSDGETGVWIEANSTKARKICAMGVKCSRWVTMHGIGFNVNTDLSYFNHIVPCGIQGKGVTSMQAELGYSVDMGVLKKKLLLNLANVFDFDYVI